MSIILRCSELYGELCSCYTGVSVSFDSDSMMVMESRNGTLEVPVSIVGFTGPDQLATELTICINVVDNKLGNNA